MISVDDNDDREKSSGEVVQFPKTAEERKALRKAKQDQEKQRLINVFINEAGGDQALFHTSDQIAYADVLSVATGRRGQSAQSNFDMPICGTCGGNSISFSLSALPWHPQ